MDSLPSHRRALTDEEPTFSDLWERVRHMKIMIRIGLGSAESDVWPLRNRILDMHRSMILAWPDELKVKVENSSQEAPVS